MRAWRSRRPICCRPFAAIVAATLIGSAAWFAAGRRYGVGVLRLLCRFSLTPDACVSRTEGAFGRWGWSALVVGRFVPGISRVAPPLAGALGMGWSRFLALTAAGATLYGIVLVGAGWLLHAQIEAAVGLLDELGWHALGGIGGLLVLSVAWRWWLRRRMARKPAGCADQASPSARADAGIPAPSAPRQAKTA